MSKQTFNITSETTQEEMIAHCVANNTVGGEFGMTRDYDLRNWTWPVYRGFKIYVYWKDDRKNVKKPYSPNDRSWHKDSYTVTLATKCDHADKPFFTVDLPAFEIYSPDLFTSSNSLSDIRKAVDKAIFNGETYWGWTDTDRTTHQIKRKKYT